MSLRGPRLRCGLTARFDLPPTEEHLPEVAAQVVECVLRDSPRQVALLVYDELEWSSDARPHQSLVDELEHAFEASGIGVKEAVYVGTERYWSFTCRSRRCCPDEGTSIERTRATQVAAELVLQGRVPVADREQLVSAVAPRGALTTSAVASVARRELGERGHAPGETSPEPDGAWLVDVLETFAELVARTQAEGRPEISGDEAGRVLAGLTDIEIRDAVAAQWSSFMLDPAERGDPDDPSGPAARPPLHEDDPVTAVLLELSVMSDGWLAVAPLTLLAAQYWSSGEGALANAAVERALTIDPRYRLANLVGRLLQAGVPPAWAARRDDAAGSPEPDEDQGRLVS
jgi:hypothetical protein